MALTPQQLQALFQGIASGNQGAFASSTPGMSQDERNQWINQYGTGGTGYRDFLSWYAGNHGTSGQVGSVNPGTINTTGSWNVNNPTGSYITPSAGGPTGANFQSNGMFNGQGGGGMPNAATPGTPNPNTPPPTNPPLGPNYVSPGLTGQYGTPVNSVGPSGINYNTPSSGVAPSTTNPINNGGIANNRTPSQKGFGSGYMLNPWSMGGTRWR